VFGLRKHALRMAFFKQFKNGIKKISGPYIELRLLYLVAILPDNMESSDDKDEINGITFNK
jgi:hypothetical protein